MLQVILSAQKLHIALLGGHVGSYFCDHVLGNKGWILSSFWGDDMKCYWMSGFVVNICYNLAIF